MRAAAVNAVFIPSPGVHEGFHHEAERHAARALERLEQFAEFGVLATAAREVLERVVDLVLEKSLQLREVHEITDMPDGLPTADEVTDDRAIRIATGQRGEVLVEELAAGLLHDIEEDVRGVQPGRVVSLDPWEGGRRRAEG